MSPLLLVALKGFPGSGKSVIAQAVSARFGWPLIDKDDLLDILVDQHENAGRLAYDAMWHVARRQLLQGLSVVCDSPLSHPIGYHAARRTAAETGAILVIVECRCSDEALWRTRLEARVARRLAPHRATSWEQLQEIRDRVADQAAYPIADQRMVVDTAGDLTALTTRVATWLSEVGWLTPPRRGGADSAQPW